MAVGAKASQLVELRVNTVGNHFPFPKLFGASESITLLIQRSTSLMSAMVSAIA